MYYEKILVAVMWSAANYKGSETLEILMHRQGFIEGDRDVLVVIVVVRKIFI